MQRRTVGDVSVSAIGLGAMWLSMKTRRPSEAEATRTIHAALDAGVTLIDTADNYGQGGHEIGHNERLVGRAVRSWSGDASELLIATKGGHVLDADGRWAIDGSPSYIRKACDRSRQALGVDTIDLYFYHRPDPSTPWEETIGAFDDLRHDGKIRQVGISNVSIDQLERARAVTEVAAVQNEFAPGRRASQPELARCGELGIAFMPWRPLGGVNAEPGASLPCPGFAAVAERHGVSPQRIALAWQLSLGSHVIPIPGTTRTASILDSLGAVEVTLTRQDLDELHAPCDASEDDALPIGVLD